MQNNELIEILKEFDEKRVEQLNDNARNLFYAIMDIADSRDKYKSLYENEKAHTDTLKRIIKEVKENLERHLTAKSYGNHKYELFGREYLEEILDLLKEIK